MKPNNLLFFVGLFLLLSIIIQGVMASELIKGSLHQHTGFSAGLGYDGRIGGGDGCLPPLEGHPFEGTDVFDLADQAIDLGLSYLAFSDHSYCINSSEFNTVKNDCIVVDNDEDNYPGFTCLIGEELSVSDAFNDGIDPLTNITCHNEDYGEAHIGAYGISSLITQSPSEVHCPNEYSAQEGINQVTSDGGFSILNHPFLSPQHSSVWALDFDSYFDVLGEKGIEVWNGELDGDDEETIESWINDFLQSNRKIYSYAGTDEHGGVSDVNYNYVEVNNINPSSLKSALQSGDVAISNNGYVFIEAKTNTQNYWTKMGGNFDANIGETLTVRVKYDIEHSCTLLVYLSEIGSYIEDSKRFDLSAGSGEFELPRHFLTEEGDYYIRARCSGSGGDYRIYTNPIWFEVLSQSCQCGAWTPTSCGAGSCGDDQMRYVRSCNPQGCSIETKCEYDPVCSEPGEPPTNCEEPGYEFCVKNERGDCDVSMALNLYDNVNDIQWGFVNDSFDPYVVANYSIGWKAVDADLQYYAVEDPDNDCDEGGCDTGEEIDDVGTRVTVTAPGIAYQDIVAGYDEGLNYWCTVWFWRDGPFEPNYGSNNPIYVLNCFDNDDCTSGQICDKSGNWNTWECIDKKADGESCAEDYECDSGYCDNDGLGLEDDGWCFTPYEIYFDGEENTYCEYSTGNGTTVCDERQIGDNLDMCLGISYYEEECSSICDYQDDVAIFECGDNGCSCAQPLCDGLSVGGNITSCVSGENYFADSCTASASGQDRGDIICRSSVFALDCTGDSRCNGIGAGTGNCSSICTWGNSPSVPTTLLCDGELCTNNGIFSDSIAINCSGSIDPENNTITYVIDSYYNHTGPVEYVINQFSNSKQIENLTFSGNQNITRYLEISRNATMNSAYLNLSGFDVFNNTPLEDDTEDAWDAPTIYWLINRENAVDENWGTYTYLDSNPPSNRGVTFYENFTIPPKTVAANWTYKVNCQGDQCYRYGRDYIRCRRNSGEEGFVLNWATNPTEGVLENLTAPIPNECLNNSNGLLEMSYLVKWRLDGDIVSFYEGKVDWYSKIELQEPYLEIGTPDQSYEWNFTGIFNQTYSPTGTNNLSSAINSALNGGACDCQGCSLNGNNCSVPFLFHSNSAGILQYSLSNITYDLIQDRYAWNEIGNHREGLEFDWNLSDIEYQPGVDLRCKAIDLGEGSNVYSDYYDPAINITIVNVSNYPPTTPTTLLCGGEDCPANNSFYNSIEINCSGSVDSEADNIIYSIEGYYVDPVLADNSTNSFNNSLQEENLTFIENENITRYLRLPMNASVASAYLNLSGFHVNEMGYTGRKFPTYLNALSGVETNGTYIWVTSFSDGDVYRFYVNETFIDGFNTVSSGNAKPFGIAFDGEYLWITDRDDAYIYKYYLNGTYTGSGFNTTVDDHPIAITFDGTYFWITDYYHGQPNSTVYKYHLNGTYTGENFETGVIGNAHPGGITEDGTYFWITDLFNDLVYKYYFNGTYTGISFDISDTAYGPYGITEDGTYFWIGSVADNYVYKYFKNETYLLNPYLEIGTSDGLVEWSSSGEFNQENEITGDISSEINSALNGGACDCEDCIVEQDECLIPFTFHSDRAGVLKYSGINISYQTQGEWKEIGNHTDSSTLIWNISSFKEQSGVDLKCRAIDLEGSEIYSDYYGPAMSVSIINPLDIPTLEVIFQNNTERVFRFVIENTFNSQIDDISWNLDTGENNETSQYNTILESGEDLFTYVHHDYGSGGNYTVIAEVQIEDYISTKSINIEV
ncbi:hypothetical protein J4423_02945 [Candidatus Pacearchaeota archaeon]|nr:hypothetical protein [Candidatus Pacearchaeota archaeon]